MASPSRIPFAGMVQRANDLMDTPLAKLFGKGMWVLIAGAGAVALYAGKAKLHEEISIDPNVVMAMKQALSAEHKATAIDQLLSTHSAEITSLHGTDEKLASALQEISRTAQHIDVSVSTLAQKQEDAQREQRENIHRIDTTLNSILSKK